MPASSPPSLPLIRLRLTFRAYRIRLHLCGPLAAGDARVKVGRPLDFETIWRACISFYVGRILNVQARKPIEEGSSRTLCRCRSTAEGASVALPFGWLLLILK